MSSSPLSWALVATALFFFFFAVLQLWRSARAPEGKKEKERLGCGFALVAFLVWTFAFGRILGGFTDGVRLALGLVLLLPVVHALAQPSGAKILRSALALFVAILLAGPVVLELARRLDRSEHEAVQAELEARVAELRAALAGLDEDLARLAAEREELRARIAESGSGDFESLDADALARLRRLSELDGLLATTQARADALRAELPRLEADVERLRLGGSALSGPELESMRNRPSEPPPSEGGPVSVEELLEREKLRELYEEEFRRR
jgi:hypothetical protein